MGEQTSTLISMVTRKLKNSEYNGSNGIEILSKCSLPKLMRETFIEHKEAIEGNLKIAQAGE